MKDLERENVTLCLPDKDGDVEVETDCLSSGYNTYIPFKDLYEWVIAIHEQKKQE